MDFINLIKEAVAKDASDIFLIAGQPVAYKCRREIFRVGDNELSSEEAEKTIDQIYAISAAVPSATTKPETTTLP
jgi:twitching motility protein PilT